MKRERNLVSKQFFELADGGKVEVSNFCVKVHSTDGNCVIFNGEGKCLGEDRGSTPEWMRHFFLMGKAERAKVEEWYENVNPTTKAQRFFLERVKDALDAIDYDYKIATLEPSFDEDGDLCYVAGNKVAEGMDLLSWKKKAKGFYLDSNWHSELATLMEGELFVAYRIAMGYWSIGYVCDNSSSAGNYGVARMLEYSGAREVGGFRDGTGNTRKVYCTKKGFAITGGDCFCSGFSWPVAHMDYEGDGKEMIEYASPVVVLRHN